MGKLEEATVNDNDLIGDLDAAHWAERFVARTDDNPAIASDEGAMLAWFATCIEGTRDAVTRELHDRLGNDHYAVFGAGGWFTEHSVECRLAGGMAECRYHAAVALVAGPDLAGRWKITGIDSEGLPDLERAEVTSGA